MRSDCITMEKEIADLESERDALRKEVERLRRALEHILEYWNRDQNNMAMSDALYHILDTAENALRAISEAGKE